MSNRDQRGLAYCLCLPMAQAGLGSCAHHPHSTEVVVLNLSFQKSMAGSGCKPEKIGSQAGFGL